MRCHELGHYGCCAKFTDTTIELNSQLKRATDFESSCICITAGKMNLIESVFHFTIYNQALGLDIRMTVLCLLFAPRLTGKTLLIRGQASVTKADDQMSKLPQKWACDMCQLVTALRHPLNTMSLHDACKMASQHLVELICSHTSQSLLLSPDTI